MAPITTSVEISRRPEDVFDYVTDPTKLPEWQQSVVSVECADAPVRVGTRAVVARQVGRREMTMSAEIAELDPPRSWAIRGLDGPVRGDVNGRIGPLEDGARSRVTITLELHGHGVGRLLLPLFVRRKAQQEMPQNARQLKDVLERTRPD